VAEPVRSRLLAHLAARLGEGGATAGMAAAIGARPEVSAAWLPESLPREPAFLVYSITKTFTAALALILQAEGRLSLDDALARWFPDVDRAQAITLRRPYGLGVMADPASPLGPLFGHNGGGPGYDASAFHAPRAAPGGATVCALCAVEGGFAAENLVLDALAWPWAREAAG
jgi:hypothetical protein